MRALGSMVVVLATATMGATSVAAQMRIEATPFAGAALILSDLTEEFGTEQVTQSHGNALALGAHVGARWPRFSLEATFVFVPTEITTESASQQVAFSEDQTILILGLSGLVNLPISPFMDGFLAAGAGIKQYSADDPLDPPGFESGSDIMFNVGGGIRLAILPTMHLRLDVRDYMSSFDAFELVESSQQDPQLQHDLLLTVGLSIQLSGR